jgi:hypothetical protein
MQKNIRIELPGCSVAIASIDGEAIALVRANRRPLERPELAITRFWASPDSQRLNDWAVTAGISWVKICSGKGDRSAEIPSYSPEKYQRSMLRYQAIVELS